jgi:outer membrane protein OmpA-like peptidoglycan-associated protein
MKTAILVLVMMLFSLPASGQSDQPLTLECTAPDVVRSDIRSVTEGDPHLLVTTPVNQIGEHIPDLGPSDFRIARGRKLATIHDVTEITAVENTVMRVVLMVDNSQSMSPWLGIMHRTLEKALLGLSPAVRVSVMFFREGENRAPAFEHNGRPLPMVRLPYTYDKGRAVDYAKRMLTERNLTRNTYLYDGVYAAAQQIAADTGAVDKSFAIIFSDGEDNRSTVDAETALRSAAQGTTYFTIDYLTSANKFLVDLAAATGGEHFLARNAEEISGIFDEIAKKIVAKGYHVTFSFRRPPMATLSASTSELVMEEEIVRETFPLLNYVFFDQNSSTIPERYVRLTAAQVADFDESAIDGGAMDFYYNVLNVLGSRLKSNPEAGITLNGYHSNTGPERNAAQLARGRAEAVRDYLRTVWGVEDERISLAAGALPPVASSSRDTMGQTENRRVEISSDDWRILRPVTFVRRLASVVPEQVQFLTSIDAEEGLESWRLTTEQNNASFDQRSALQAEQRITWNWKNRAGELPASEGDLRVRFAVTDKAGDSYVTEALAIAVREVKHESRKNVTVMDGITVEKISLILFPFDVAEPGQRNERIMDDYVYPRLSDEVTIDVSGYTDIIGSEEYNLRLSQQRADAVRAILLRRLGDAASERITSTGLGETSPVFSNDTPEGRFYNRTVSLRIER